MKILTLAVLVWAALVCGCNVWVQAAGRTASNTHHGHTTDNSNSRPASTRSTGPQEVTTK